VLRQIQQAREEQAYVRGFTTLRAAVLELRPTLDARVAEQTRNQPQENLPAAPIPRQMLSLEEFDQRIS
jgi:hypothetical protein